MTDFTSALIRRFRYLILCSDYIQRELVDVSDKKKAGPLGREVNSWVGRVAVFTLGHFARLTPLANSQAQLVHVHEPTRPPQRDQVFCSWELDAFCCNGWSLEPASWFVPLSVVPFAVETLPI